jgi:phosphate transport system substrate-binding protein
MNFIKTIILLIFLMVFPFCKSGNNDKNRDNLKSESQVEITGEFSISGGDALYPLVRKWAEDFIKIHPNIKINLDDGGTGQGISDLRAKKSQLAMISRPLTDEELTDSIWTIAVAKAGVAPIINQKNPYFKRILERGINPEKLIRLYTANEPVTWGELIDTLSKEKAIVYTRDAESGAAVIWADFLWKQSTDLKGIRANGDKEMIKDIQGNPLAIGYCNFSYAFDSITGERTKDIQVLPIDLDFDHSIDKKEIPFANIHKAHRGLWLGYYPKNLTRELTFGAVGKPSDPAILAFLTYALTTGQASVGSSGFCELNDIYVKNSLDKLK